MNLRIQNAFNNALMAATALAISHTICVTIVMYFDLSGKWKQYSLNPNRNVSIKDYYVGMQSFFVDLMVLFIPFMTICFYYRSNEIRECNDTILLSIMKLLCGYVLGKVWAFIMHYALHHPKLYHYHKRHHRNPRTIVAAAAWEDSYIEYMVMELPSFGITVGLFPTYFWIHCIHFILHGWDGACGHSGFKAPGILGYLFDGEYHYYHHAYLTLNYAELEIIDKLAGTHHSQKHMYL